MFRLLTLFVLVCGVVESKIIETATIVDVIPLIEDNTWLILDLDHTIYEGKEALGHSDWIYSIIDKKVEEEGITLEEAIDISYPEWIKAKKRSSVKPVEEGFIPALLDLQKRNIVMMGLTQQRPSLVPLTVRDLSSIGLSFLPTAPLANTFNIFTAGPATYTQGILFVGDYNKKGETFLKFLTMIDQRPQKVVFMDDKIKHVQEMEKTLTGQGIEYIGIHYTAIDFVEKVYYPEIAEIQRKLMSKTISNEAARILIEHGLE